MTTDDLQRRRNNKRLILFLLFVAIAAGTFLTFAVFYVLATKHPGWL